jgi:cysteine synthase
MGKGIASEKIEMMRTFGAEVILTPPVPFTSPDHYFHRAATAAYEGNLKDPGSHFFTNRKSTMHVPEQPDGRLTSLLLAYRV